MEKRILLRIQNKFIKGIVLRYILESGYDAVDIMDYDDLRFKLDIYLSEFMLYIMEVSEENLPTIFVETSDLKSNGSLKNIPILALVPRDTSDIVSSAIKSGVEDILLLPKGKELYKAQLTEKLMAAFKKLDPVQSIKEQERMPVASDVTELIQIREQLENELKHASRGKYPISLLMIRFMEVDNDKSEKFIDRLRLILRETDRVYRFKDQTWLITCPFTEKKYIIEVERKVSSTFEAEFGIQRDRRKINMYTAVYPHDEENLDNLFERLEIGINNSMAINSITAPLNSLTRDELENYRNKIRQYKKFF